MQKESTLESMKKELFLSSEEAQLFLQKPCGVFSAQETLESVHFLPGALEAVPDMARVLLEVFRLLRPGGILRLDILPRQKWVTTWTDIVAELLFPHLAEKRLCRIVREAWYSFSPTVLRGILRQLFMERMIMDMGLEKTLSSEEKDVFTIHCRKCCSLEAAFPWCISEIYPEIGVKHVVADNGFSCLHVVSSLPDPSPVTGSSPFPGIANVENHACRQKSGEVFPKTGNSVSIVMASLNAGSTLCRTLESLAAQTCPPLELIVQDGGSIDDTLMIFEAFQKKCLFPISLVSESDSGIYEAWNRALARVRGDWILFLGADDRLEAPDVLDRVVHYLENLDREILFAYGSLAFCRSGEVTDIWAPDVSSALSRMCVAQAHVSDSRFMTSGEKKRPSMGLPFPATFLRRDVFSNRCFDTSYRVAADFRLVAELATSRNVAQFPVLVTRMELGGMSSQARYHLLTEAERIRAARELDLLP